MTRGWRWGGVATVAMLAGTARAADDAKDKDKPAEKAGPTVKISGLIFPFWSLDLTDGADDKNSFDIDRAYFRADAKITDAISARITLDAGRESSVDVALPDGSTVTVPEDQRYRIFLKHAWLAWKATDEIDVKGGMIDTPMVPFVENYTNFRWISKAFLDDAKLEQSADLGVNIAGKHADGLFSWVAGVYNGEGYSTPETGSGKSMEARVTVDPLAPGKKIGLPITAFIDEDLHEDPVKPETVFAGDLGFHHPNMTFSGEVIGHSQDTVMGLGESALLAPGTPDIGFVYFRVDHWDPDGQTDKDDYLKIQAGLGHDFYDKISLGAFYVRQMFSADPSAPSHGIYVRAQAGF